MNGQSSFDRILAGLLIFVFAAFVLGIFLFRGPHAGVIPVSKSNGKLSDQNAQKAIGEYQTLNEAVGAARHKIEFVDGERLIGHPSGGYVAQNKANDMAAIFTPDGTEIKAGKNETALSSMWKLTSVSRGSEIVPVPAETKMSASGDRFSYNHMLSTGPVEERFVNKPSGIEQSFIVADRPIVNEQIAMLRLTLAVGGDLIATADGTGQTLDLRNTNGALVLSYQDLHVWDAGENKLPARMITERSGEVWIDIDDKDAVYPITVDPTFVRMQELKGNDTAGGDQFGRDLGFDGKTAVIGADLADIAANVDQGAAYVFVRNGSSWVQQAKLTAADGIAGDEFGYSVAIKGDTIVVGAIGSNSGKGAAYVFVRNGSAWTQQAKLSASDGATDDRFGWSAAIETDTVAIGAVTDHVSDSTGSVYIYKRNGAAWSEQQKIFRTGGFTNIGSDISIDANTLAVIHASGFFIYIFNGTSWVLQADITYPSNFVALQGDTIVLNAANFSFNTPGARVYTRSGTTWTMLADLNDSGYGDAAIDGDNIFAGGSYWRRSGSTIQKRQTIAMNVNGGISSAVEAVAIKGDTIFTGGGSLSNNRARVYSVAGGLDLPQPSSGSDSVAGDNFGFSTAIDGETAIVGSPGDDFISASNQGSAYIFVRNGNTWSQQAKLFAADGAANDVFGISVDIARDMVLIGAQDADVNSLSNSGAAYIFTRSGTTWTQTQKLKADVPAAGDEFGKSVNFGPADASNNISGLYIGAPMRDDGAANAGAVYYFINHVPWGQVAKINPSDPQANDRFGYVVHGFTGGVVVGTPFKDVNLNADQGSVYTFDGSGTQLQQLVNNTGANAGDNFGASLAVYEDRMIVGVRGADVNGNANQGRAYVYTRLGNSWTLPSSLTAPDGAAGDFFGSSVGFANEIAVIGAPGAAVNAQSGAGAAYVFNRDGSFSFFKKIVNSVPASGDEFGIAAAVADNTVVVTSDTDDGGKGSASFFTITPKTTSPTCDFDGDGKSDISVFRPATGAWYLNRSTAGVLGTTWGVSTDKITPADYDGDGKTDIAVFRPSDGRWYIFYSATSTFSSNVWGVSTDIPAPGDFDGDGKADTAIFRPSDGNWWLNRTTAGTLATQFGQNGDLPVVGDYDGDGKSDIGIFRPSNGVWFIRRSTAGDIGYQFGFGTDKLAEADYDGDGKTDIAIYRPSTGQWFIANSGSATYPVIGFGAATDIPTPGDYDGDGKADVAIFRPSDGNWWLNRSTAGVTVMQFGQNGDKPVPNAFGN